MVRTKKLFLAAIIFLFAKNVCAVEIHPMIGVWDYKHDTDAVALNFKIVDHNNDINIKYLGKLQRTYDVSFFFDVNQGFSHLDMSNNTWNNELSAYIGTGIARPFYLTHSAKLYFVPSFSIGLYQEFENGKDMGFPIEFKSEVGLNYSAFKNSIIGVSYNHISNADIGDKNPGSDNILFTFRLKEIF